jgi:hypothetical protein
VRIQRKPVAPPRPAPSLAARASIVTITGATELDAQASLAATTTGSASVPPVSAPVAPVGSYEEFMASMQGLI